MAGERKGQERELLKAFSKCVHFCWQTEAGNVNWGQREVSFFTGPASSSRNGGGVETSAAVIICNCNCFLERFCGPDMKVKYAETPYWNFQKA